MSLVSWPDGLVHGPDGPCRQVPQEFTWTSVVFITKDGTARRRHYNPVAKTWTFDADPVPLAWDAKRERLGFHVVGHWISSERAVLLAWAHRHPDATSAIVGDADAIELVGASSHANAQLPFAWAHGEVVCEPGPLDGETWKPLKWTCGLCPVPKGYRISNHGRLKNVSSGRVTSGLWYKGDRWAAVRDGALVNLTVASGLRGNTVDLTPALWQAAEALGHGEDPVDLADATAVQISTAWNRFNRVAPFFPADDLKARVARLVSPDLWALVTGMVGAKEAAVGGSLTELMDVVLKRLPRTGAFRRSEYQFEQLRLARLAAIR